MDKNLFFYELEGRGYIFQNKKWDEAKHGFEDDMLNMAWEMWSSGQATKAQAVLEGFVIVSQKDLLELTIAINAVDLATHTESKTNEVREMWQQVALKLMALGISQEQGQ